MMRILFVDDDPMVLEGLQNSLRRQRKEWEMCFVASGELALAEMRKKLFDVIVSDMRMSGIDGAELMTSIQELFPSTTRIILTGQADQQSLVRALGVTHRFIGKPCEPDVLRQCLERVANIRHRLKHPRLRALVGTLNALPPVPKVYQEFLAEIQREDASIDRISTIIERDPSIAVKVLQIANSAVFSTGRATGSIRIAASMVGFEVLRAFVLAASVFTVPGSMTLQDWVSKLQEHSLQVAMVAQGFLSDAKEREDAYTAGLLHDVGYVVFRLAAEGDPKFEGRTDAVELAQEARWGIKHSEVGAYLLGTWGLPMHIVEAVAFHECPDEETAKDRTTLAVHVADRVVEALEAKKSPQEAHLDWKFLESVEVASTVRGWLRQLQEESTLSSDDSEKAA